MNIFSMKSAVSLRQLNFLLILCRTTIEQYANIVYMIGQLYMSRIGCSCSRVYTGTCIVAGLSASAAVRV